jgi:hypothetical protein
MISEDAREDERSEELDRIEGHLREVLAAIERLRDK